MRFSQERGNYFPYVVLNEILTMFSQLAKRSSRVLPADLCIDHAYYIKNQRSRVLRRNKKHFCGTLFHSTKLTETVYSSHVQYFFRLIHILLTFSERDVGTALSYSDKNHFEASTFKKANFKSRIWKWSRHHFRKLFEVVHFSLRHVAMAKIIRTNILPSSPAPPPPLNYLL